jgi:hypothetical protein
MKYVIESVGYKDITPIKLNQIVNLKMQHWDYSRGEHLNWITANIFDGDYHLLILDDLDYLIAYLNLVKVTVNYSSNSAEYFGIGNVCVDKKYRAKGFGLLLMNFATFKIKQLNVTGILLCKEDLNSFYHKAGWNLYSGSSFIKNKLNTNSVFTTDEIVSPELNINKDF